MSHPVLRKEVNAFASIADQIEEGKPRYTKNAGPNKSLQCNSNICLPQQTAAHPDRNRVIQTLIKRLRNRLMDGSRKLIISEKPVSQWSVLTRISKVPAHGPILINIPRSQGANTPQGTWLQKSLMASSFRVLSLHSPGELKLPSTLQGEHVCPYYCGKDHTTEKLELRDQADSYVAASE
ncbi:hypothetical protein llap_6199 [Limosa lapponica baueri]|uniref:Uncharacterized protein n=1 Tax=Limosa lapponica baueri TaxID=1758121 RepID=A0A2I0UBT4_LIMLA|nr:hypothetical protein llap_6199 [Limosa lapponica baueri]